MWITLKDGSSIVLNMVIDGSLCRHVLILAKSTSKLRGDVPGFCRTSMQMNGHPRSGTKLTISKKKHGEKETLTVGTHAVQNHGHMGDYRRLSTCQDSRVLLILGKTFI